MDKAANLRSFFADAANSTTRERIFFNRLSFDLKIAAARAGYHLHLYEPDVDRDGFDIVAEDEDTVGWYQTKAVLSSAVTAEWKISVGFLRPAQHSAEAYQFDPPDAGRGGGIILIEISDETADGQVTYRYTDFHILAAIAEGFLVERPYSGPGRPAKAARLEASKVITLLRSSARGDKIVVPKCVFVTVGTSDDLLGVMGLRSEAGYGMYAVKNAYREVTVDQSGRLAHDADRDIAGALYHQMGLLRDAQPKVEAKSKVVLFDPFEGCSSERVLKTAVCQANACLVHHERVRVTV